MIKKLVFILGLIPFTLLAQTNTSIDLVGGIDISYRTLSQNGNDFANTEIIDGRNDEEDSDVAFRFGFNYNKRLTQKVIFKTGIRYMSEGYTRYKSFDGTSWPSGDPVNNGFSEFKYNYRFIEIPLMARIELNQNKLSPYIEFGFSPSVYINTRQVNDNSLTGKSTDTYRDPNTSSEMNKLQFVGVVAFGANYQLNESIQLFGQPTFRYHFTKLAATPVREHLFNYGIEFGARKFLN